MERGTGKEGRQGEEERRKVRRRGDSPYQSHFDSDAADHHYHYYVTWHWQYRAPERRDVVKEASLSLVRPCVTHCCRPCATNH